MSYDSGSNYKYPKQDNKPKEEPVRQVLPDEWALRDIDLIIGHADLNDTDKIKQIKKVLENYWATKKT